MTASDTPLPKSDRRYKAGRIAKDRKGAFRGHPDTVELKRMEIPQGAPIGMRLNPPLVISNELAKHLKGKL